MSWKEDLLEYFRNPNREDVMDYLQNHLQKEYLLHLHPARFAFLAWYPLNSNLNVLEVNAGSGAISEGYIHKVKHLDFYEEDQELVQIAKERFKDHSNITFLSTIKKKQYDLIIVTGVYSLELINSLLPMTKKMIFTFENPYSLANFAGNISVNASKPYDLLTSKQFSKSHLEQLLATKQCSYTFYYPYPDAFFTVEIYSDQHLPKLGDLIGYSYDYQINQTKSFDEIKVRDQLISQNQYVEYMNAYIVEVENHAVL